MSYILRNGCKLCKNIQYLHNVSKTQYYRFYSKSIPLPRGITTLSQNWYLNKPKEVSYDSEVLQSCLEEVGMSNVEHDVGDEETLYYEKGKYLDKGKEEVGEVEEGKEVNTKKKLPKQQRKIPRLATHEGKQMTVHGEQNVLTEIDIYLYLGELSKAVNLFNFHRRHGHRFSIDVYNKIIHVMAARKSWGNIQLVLHSMRKENIELTYQTYAGLLEACGIIGAEASVHVENLLNEMHCKNMNIKELLRESLVTKQQIEAIQNALQLVNESCFDSSLDKGKTLENGNVSNFVQMQIEQELEGSILIKPVETSKLLSESVLRRSDLYQTIIAQWKKDFISEMTRVQAAKDKKSILLYSRCVTYGCVLSPDELADIVFENIIPEIASRSQGVTVGVLCRKLGDMIYRQFCLNFQKKTGVVEKVTQIANKISFTETKDGDDIPRKKWKEISDHLYHLPSESLLPSPWSKKIKTMASSVVLDTLKKVTNVDTSLFLKKKRGTIENSLYHVYESQDDKHPYQVTGMMKFHPAIVRLYSNYLSHVGKMWFPVNQLPMVVPPKPWLTPICGGYLLLNSDFIRGISGYKGYEELTNNADALSKIFDALNYVGNCAWKVNGKLLDIMIQLFNSQGDTNLYIIGSDMMEVATQNKMDKSNHWKERKIARKEYNEILSLRMDLLYKLSVANHFRDDVLWIPNNIDFRGRCYPVAPHCCHIGNDVSRSMLMFAEGKKLGENGLDWLKIHLVNVHGQLKKASLKERIKFADSHIDDIMDSADNPLTGRKWWQGSSDPWQTLIACMEVTDAIRSGDPANFVSHLPVQQDGSCNGLQHYAALGRDLYGAKQVNLMPAEKPYDVYTEVANFVEKQRQEDANNDVLIAQQLAGKITRKVVKQTVMTVVYGVTFVGGRLQVEKQLKELNIDKAIIFQASVYVVREVFTSLTHMFTSARQIQDWLTLSAAQIALTGHCVDWESPLQLPIIQQYRRPTKEIVSTPIQSIHLTNRKDITQLPHLTQQKGGFPPNFIHSLDSTHLMLTALRCQQEQMVFTSVHDSFWTHACDINKMNKFCREEFIYLHKLPILQDLKKHFDKQYSGLPLRMALKDGRRTCHFDDLPETGEFDIDNVLNSVYFFS